VLETDLIDEDNLAGCATAFVWTFNSTACYSTERDKQKYKREDASGELGHG
jgi:hypothetical protein